MNKTRIIANFQDFYRKPLFWEQLGYLIFDTIRVHIDNKVLALLQYDNTHDYVKGKTLKKTWIIKRGEGIKTSYLLLRKAYSQAIARLQVKFWSSRGKIVYGNDETFTLERPLFTRTWNIRPAEGNELIRISSTGFNPFKKRGKVEILNVMRYKEKHLQIILLMLGYFILASRED